MEQQPQRRGVAFKVAIWVFAVASFGGLLGFSVFTAWFDKSDAGIHRVHYMGFGVLYGVLLTTAFAVQNWRPERKISAFYQILDVALATLIGGAVATSGAAATFGVILLVAYVIVFWLHPHRALVTHPQREGFSATLMALTVAGAIPLIWFALSSASLQRNGIPLDPHVKNGHWTLMASMAFGIVLVAFLSAFKFSGWKISARCAGAGLALYGLIATVYPHRAGAEGTGWGLAALLGGLLFIGAAEWEARRTPGSR
jgi:hypothetical protein